MYHESLDEMNKVKSEFEARIITANDNYEKIQSENEILKEKVDVLFKLGRSYINNSKQKENNSVSESKNSDTVKEIDVIAIGEEKLEAEQNERKELKRRQEEEDLKERLELAKAEE